MPDHKPDDLSIRTFGTTAEKEQCAQEKYNEAAKLFDSGNDPFLDARFFPDVDEDSLEAVNLDLRYGWKAASSHQQCNDWKYAVEQADFSREAGQNQKPNSNSTLEKSQGSKSKSTADCKTPCVKVEAFRELPFYGEGVVLLHGKVGESDTKFQKLGEDCEYFRAVFLADRIPYQVQLLDGSSSPIHELNAKRLNEGRFRLENDGFPEEYLRYFCEHVQGDMGGFHVCEFEAEPAKPRRLHDESRFDEYLRIGILCNQLGPELHLVKDTSLVADAFLSGGTKLRVAQDPFDHFPPPTELNGLFRVDPAHDTKEEDEEVARFLTTVFYGGHAFRALFSIQRSGNIEMIDDYPLIEPDKFSGLLWNGAKSKNFYKILSDTMNETAENKQKLQLNE